MTFDSGFFFIFSHSIFLFSFRFTHKNMYSHIYYSLARVLAFSLARSLALTFDRLGNFHHDFFFIHRFSIIRIFISFFIFPSRNQKVPFDLMCMVPCVLFLSSSHFAIRSVILTIPVSFVRHLLFSLWHPQMRFKGPGFWKDGHNVHRHSTIRRTNESIEMDEHEQRQSERVCGMWQNKP